MESELMPAPTEKWNQNQFQPKQEMELRKCTQNVNLNCQLVANLQRGRTYNSYVLRVTCPYSLEVSYQLTKKV